MKTSGKLLVAAIGFSVANVVFAAATIKDVENAVKVNHDYVQAEKLMRDVVANNENNAYDHFKFSQILEHNDKLDEAKREFAEVKRLDPAYSFEKDPSRVAAFEHRLGAETSNAPVYVPPTPHAAPRVDSHFAPPQVQVMPPPVPVAQKSGHTLLWVVLILVLVGVAAYFFLSRTQAKDRAEDEERMKARRQDQLKQANSLLESIKPLRLDMRMASPPDAGLLAELDDVEKQLIGLIERLSTAPIAQDEIEQQSAKLAQLRRKFEGRPEPVSAPAAAAAPAPLSEQGGQTVYQGGQYANPGMPINNGMNPVYQPGYPQGMAPVYVEQNSGLGGVGAVGGVLAGMAIGSMLSGNHDREVIREIHEVREVPVPQYEERQQAAPRDDIDFDDGNSSSGNDSSSGGDVDFGDSDDN